MPGVLEKDSPCADLARLAAGTFLAPLSFAFATNGVLFKPGKVEVQIWDDAADGGSARLFPAVIEGDPEWVDETELQPAALARLGIFTPIDPETGLPWAPSDSTPRARVVWRLDSGITFERDFEVLESGTGPLLLGATVADLRSLGLPVRVTDVQAVSRLREWTLLFERLARQRFRPALDCRVFKGRNSGTVFLPEPLVGLYHVVPGSYSDPASLSRAAAGTALMTRTADENLAIMARDFRVSATRGEERRNPTIELATDTAVYPLDLSGGFPVITSPGNYFTLPPQFAAGQPYTAFGVWGFVEDESQDTPLVVRTAIAQGTMLSLGYTPRGLGVTGAITGETTDGHSISYAIQTGAISGGLLSLLRNPAIRDALTLYRAPRAIGAISGGL